ncbi:MAG TPA: GerW family sporulation protein [Candidatus Avamphibacillus intestinigallinarum]|nr:GerW family sporulation protein [Candidatus Avamphibacillus intestinigallinarum]
MKHPIESMIGTTMDELKTMVESNSIVGDPIEMHNGTMILPITKLAFGFVSAGNDKTTDTSGDQENPPICGGSGGGVNVSPVAFLIISEDDVRMVQLQEDANVVEKAMEDTPKTIEKLAGVLKKSKKNSNTRSARHQSDDDA